MAYGIGSGLTANPVDSHHTQCFISRTEKIFKLHVQGLSRRSEGFVGVRENSSSAPSSLGYTAIMSEEFDANALERWLREDGQISSDPATLTPLTGGVSSDIYKVSQGEHSFIVKRALAKLRVAADWQADVSRNGTEYTFGKMMENTLAGNIPKVLFRNPERGYFTMEYLDGMWENWKTMLLQKHFDPTHGRLAGTLMGRLHASSWGKADLARIFDTTDNFRQLRTDPYLRATGEAHRRIEFILTSLANQLEATSLCLVHGDFSPKNLLIKGDRMILLDAEVAWYGDPAFDVAFLLALLLLKGLYHLPLRCQWDVVASEFWASYKEYLPQSIPASDFAQIDARAAHLTAAIILARIDGKSPVEYLSSSCREIARSIAMKYVIDPARGIEQLIEAWRREIYS